MAPRTPAAWKDHVLTHWQTLAAEAAALDLRSPFQQHLALVLLPIVPNSAEESRAAAALLQALKAAAPLVAALNDRARSPGSQPLTVIEMVALLHAGETSAPYDFLFQNNLLNGASPEVVFDVVMNFLQHSAPPASSGTVPALHVKTDQITSQRDVIIAGGSVYTQGSAQDAALVTYLAELRAQWNYLDLTTIIPEPIRHLQTRLYHLYAPLDVWNISPLDAANADALMRLRQRAVEQDLSNFRLSTVKVASQVARLVITGGPGTGKSTVCGYLSIGLAYACDPAAETQDQIRGLELLGEDWEHGALVPVYVRLRQFASDPAHFPNDMKDAKYTHLMGYLKGRFPELAPHLLTLLNTSRQAHGTAPSEAIHGVILLLDGLDEIYNPKDRQKAKHVIEDFALRFPHCRVLVTCRSAAYRSHMPWHLSDDFAAAELAPFTWEQVSQYVRNWYNSAAETRPGSLGGPETAHTNARKYAVGLIQTLKSSTNLWSLARQPLLLTLMVLIHEENRHLPQNRAELYEKTVTLLHKWNPPDEDDPLSQKLEALNTQRVRAVLQLTAFNTQRDRVRYKDNDAMIKRPELIAQLLNGNGMENLLGAAIDDVLEYLATRNGILVAESQDSYRFLHLSIREYLAACALIEQYDEISMPEGLARPAEDWKFPENICHLLSMDPYRWREVALFCGAILGNDRGQDRLWTYLESLLPDTQQAHDAPYDEGDMYRIAIAAEVWSDNHMRARLGSHHMIRNHLRQSLQAILTDDRLDAPEHTEIVDILRQLNSPDPR